MQTERHPLQPFLPEGATTLFLGSFPPPRAKWSMEFFYPNFQNDFWRVMGLIHYGDRDHFAVAGQRRFDLRAVVDFSTAQGLAFYDTATVVCRLRDNASDEYLDIVEPTDVAALVARLPLCRQIVTTGGKASLQLMATLGLDSQPAVGQSLPVTIAADGTPRPLLWWRMPSTSRAYPLPLEQKAAAYRRLLGERLEVRGER